MKKMLLSLLLFLSVAFCFAVETAQNIIFNIQVNGSNIINEQLSKFPISVKCHVKGKNNDGISITANFNKPKDLDGDLGIILYKNLMGCEIYVNDYYIDTIGRSGKNFFFQPYISRGILVPRNIFCF